MARRRLAFAVVAAAALAACTPATSRPGTAESLRAELLAVETAWNEAIVRHDTTTVSRILAPDFTYVGPDGEVADRAELLRVIADTAGQMEPFTTRDVTVRAYGDAAVVTGWFRQAGTWRGGAYENMIAYTDVYVCRDGRWMAVSAHASRKLGRGDPAAGPRVERR